MSLLRPTVEILFRVDRFSVLLIPSYFSCLVQFGLWGALTRTQLGEAKKLCSQILQGKISLRSGHLLILLGGSSSMILTL